MNQDLSQKLKPPLFDQLGDFAKLPPEIRYQIWNYILDYAFDVPATDHEFLRRFCCHGLAILFCNRHINEEVSYLLYRERDPSPMIFIHNLDGSGDKIDLGVKSNRNQLHRLRMRDFKDAFEQFQKFPFRRTKSSGLCINVITTNLCSTEQASKYWKRIVTAFDDVRDKPDDQCIEFTALMPEPLMRMTLRYCARHQSTTMDLTMPASSFFPQTDSVSGVSN